MTRVLVAILFYILVVAALSAVVASAESPKASKASTPAKAPEVAAKKFAPAKTPEATTTTAPVSRKFGPAVALATTSTPSSSMGEASSPPSPSTFAASPTTKGLAEGQTDADQFGDATLRSGAAMAGVAAAAVATMIFY